MAHAASRQGGGGGQAIGIDPAPALCAVRGPGGADDELGAPRPHRRCAAVLLISFPCGQRGGPDAASCLKLLRLEGWAVGTTVGQGPPASAVGR